MRDVPITDGMIRLGQLLKLADLAGGGGDIKAILAESPGDLSDAVEEALQAWLEKTEKD